MPHQEDVNATIPQEIHTFVDVREGLVGVTVAGEGIRVLTFDWTSNSSGVVKARVNWPINGTLLHLRATPGQGVSEVPSADYDVKMLDESEAEDTDILGRRAVNLGVSANLVQIEVPLSLIAQFGTDGITTRLPGIPCSVPGFVLLVENAGDTARGVLKLFYRPNA